MPHAHRASSSVPSLYLPCNAVICTTDITLTIRPHARRMLMRRRTLTHRRGADHGDEEAIRAAAHVIAASRKHKRHLNCLCFHGRSFYLHLDLFLLAFSWPPILIDLFFLQGLQSRLARVKGISMRATFQNLNHIWSVPAITGFQLRVEGITFAIHTWC